MVKKLGKNREKNRENYQQNRGKSELSISRIETASTVLMKKKKIGKITNKIGECFTLLGGKLKVVNNRNKFNKILSVSHGNDIAHCSVILCYIKTTSTLNHRLIAVINGLPQSCRLGIASCFLVIKYF